MEKKGVVMETVVVAIVLLISFVIILMFTGPFIFDFLFPAIDENSCYQSAVMRDTFNLKVLEPGRKLIPLKCETQKICFSESGSRCEDVFGESEKKTVLRHTIPSNKEPKEEILDSIADSMLKCHIMLGEGGLNFMPRSFKDKNYCLICTWFALDEDIKKDAGEISYKELYKYLGEKKTKQGTSYLEELHPEWRDWEDSENLFELFKEKSSDEKFKKMSFDEWKINLNNPDGNVIVVQIAPLGIWKSFFGGVAIAVAIPVGAGLIATGVGAPVGAVLLVSSGVGIASGGAVFWYSHPSEDEEGGFDYSPPSVQSYDIKTLQGLKCSDFSVAP